MRIMPIVSDDFPLLTFTIPDIDMCLKVSLFRGNNFPMLHLELKLQFTYVLGGKYLDL